MMDGIQSGSELGTSVITAGDVNGDGFSDVLVGVPGHDTSAVDVGAAYVFLGSQSGLSSTPAWFVEYTRSGARFGETLAPAGDVNGDGYDDILVGAPQADLPGGIVFLWYGHPTRMAATPAWAAANVGFSGRFGHALSTAGDVNGDGYDDVLIGDPWADRAWVWFGSTQGMGPSGTPSNADWSGGASHDANYGIAVATLHDVNGDGYDDIGISSQPQGTPFGLVAVHLGGVSGPSTQVSWTAADIGLPGSSGRLGFSLAGAGDVNGDGYADVLMGAPDRSVGQSQEGAAYLWFGGPSTVGDPSGLGASGTPANADWEFEANQVGARLGTCVSTAGDVNGDGLADVLLGAPDWDAAMVDVGAVFVFLGSPSGLRPVFDWMQTGTQSGAAYGLSVDTAGDANSDGFSDVIVGAPRFHGTHPDQGRTLVYEGLGALPRTVADWSETRFPGVGSLAASCDFNGDGYSELLMGVPAHDSPGLVNAGQLVVYGGSESGVSGPAWLVHGQAAGEELGREVSGAGDLNGDGYEDLVVASRIATYVFHGGPTRLSTPVALQDADWMSPLAGRVSTAGDVNGDGFSDLLVGDGTRVLLFTGGPAGLKSDGLARNAAWSAQPGLGASFASLASAGDLNGDGFGDVVLGGSSAPFVGAVLVWFGGPDGLGSRVGTAQNADWHALVSGPSPGFGAHVASAGDVNGDAFSDLIVGDPGSDRALVWFGDASGLGPTGTLANADLILSETTLAPGFGSSVTSAGDVNGDGYDDLLVGAPAYGQSLEGAAFLYLGGLAGDTQADWNVVGVPGERLGEFVAGTGDLNGDGFDDVAIGSMLLNPVPAPRASVYYGNRGGGRAHAPQAWRFDLAGRLALRGRSESLTGFALRAMTRNPAAGRTRLRMEWELRLSGQSYTRAPTGFQVSDSDSGIPGNRLTLFGLQEGLPSRTPVHWRARIAQATPYFPHGPWFTVPGAATHEVSLRTGSDCNRNNLDDVEEVRLGMGSDHNNNAILDACEAFQETDDELSLTTGGVVHFTLDAGTQNSLSIYWIVGAAGTWPRIDLGGLPLPLTVDAYFWFTLQNPNSALLPTSLGFLDAMGRGHSTLVLGANPMPNPELVGVTFHHAFFAGTLSGQVTFVSNPMPVRLVM